MWLCCTLNFVIVKYPEYFDCDAKINASKYVICHLPAIYEREKHTPLQNEFLV